MAPEEVRAFNAGLTVATDIRNSKTVRNAAINAQRVLNKQYPTNH